MRAPGSASAQTAVLSQCEGPGGEYEQAQEARRARRTYGQPTRREWDIESLHDNSGDWAQSEGPGA